MEYYMSSIAKQLYILVDEGGTLMPNFKIYNLIKGIETLEYENLKLEIRTHPDWYYAWCVEKLFLIYGSLEIKVGRK